MHDAVSATRPAEVGPPVPSAEATFVPASGLIVGILPTLRRTAAAAADRLGGSRADADVESALSRERGRGSPLPPKTATEIGAHLGADLSAVRVHTDPGADRLTRSVSSTAFTFGSDIYFSANSYQPDSPEGRHLLTHELAHVAQPDTSSGSGVTIGRADDPLEADADRVADRVTTALRRNAVRHDAGHDEVSDDVHSRNAMALRRTPRDATTYLRRDFFGAISSFVSGIFGPADTETMKKFKTAVDGAAAKDDAEGKTRLDELRTIATSMTADERKRIAGDRAVLNKAKTYVGTHNYMALVAALSMYTEGTKNGPDGKPVKHMSGAEADTFIQTALSGVPHLKDYLEEAVAAGKKADGYVAVVGDQDWKTIYEKQNPGESVDAGDDAQTNAFIANTHEDRPAIINANRGTRSTAIHESMHRYSVLNVLKTYGSGLNEGMTEYFTRKITDRNGDPAVNGGPKRNNYQSNWTFINDVLLPMLGASLEAQEVTLAEIYFRGKIELLKTKFTEVGKAKNLEDDAIDTKWTTFTEALDDSKWAEAAGAIPT